MICYRDRTYCAAKCANTDCSRNVTEEVLDGADEIGLPLALSDFSKNCDGYEEKKDD